MTDKKIWERQEKETSKAFEAFTIYRDLGTGRTFKAVADKLHKSYTIIRRWKDAWDWENRADAWDNFISDKAIKKAAEEYAKMLDVQINIGKMLQAKAATAIQNIDFENVSIKSLPAIIEAINSGIKIERSARDLNRETNQKQNLSIKIISKNRNER